MNRIVKSIFIFAMIMTCVVTNAQEKFQATTNAKVRSGPGAKFRTLGTISIGDTITVIDQSKVAWYKVEFNGKTGYVSSKLLAPVSEQEVQQQEPVVEEKKQKVKFPFIGILIIGVVVIFYFLLRKPKKTFEKKDTDATDEQLVKQHRKQQQDLAIDQLLKSVKVGINSGNKIPEKDESIIDVTGKKYDLQAPQPDYNSNTNSVPPWNHQYVYSADELHNATAEQKKFYHFFKEEFLNKRYLDVKGNSNYYFVLMFDLINDYVRHQNLPLVELQMLILDKHYPKTGKYAIPKLIEKLEQLGSIEKAEVLRRKHSYLRLNDSHLFEQDYWGLGTKNKSKHGLTDAEVEVLNKIWNPSNNFFSIPYCGEQVVKLFVWLIRSMNEKLKAEQSSFDKELTSLVDIILQKQLRYRQGSTNYKYGIDTVKGELYVNIFKRCENALRERYGHKRKLTIDSYVTNADAKLQFDNFMQNKVGSAIPSLLSGIPLPDEATELLLNEQSTGRWKEKFEVLTKEFKGTPAAFYKAVQVLAEQNKKNPAVESIFFEASKFIAKTDRETALVLYVHYLYADLKSANFDNKQFTKTIQKSLFNSNEQLHSFEMLVSELISSKDLKKALAAIPAIYAKKRKKIQLNTDSIKEVQEQHAETVDLLNEYLQDEYEDENNIIKSHEEGKTEVRIEIVAKKEEVHVSRYIDGITFTSVQEELLDMLVKNNYSILQNDVEQLAKSRSVFKNQLVDRVNEICFESLDDLLIEEEDDSYTMNPDYYKNLTAP